MKHINKITLMAIAVTVFVSCEVEPVQTLPKRNFELVWSDEFEGDSGIAPNAEKWTYDLGTGQNGWGNNELQTYTNNAQNVSLDGKGNLLITARKTGSGYTSARIKTQGIFTQQYGKIEARIKTPTGAGMWPAFWMLGNNITSVSWPQCGEIDIMEQKGKFSNITYGTIHGPGYSGGEAISTPYALQNSRFDTDFYVYAVEWNESQIDFFVNGYLYRRITPSEVKGEWVFNQPFFMILNVAVGGNFGGPPNDNTPFPGTMSIDYVRVYKFK
ncbi:MAG: glycoside hydrolase family 16 protein [Bacteroidia bacterium]|jgi:beta-glucanase (GH16 family)|nr:glycoside hydrolase family 16 protein [Bacteroidia bacterium]